MANEARAIATSRESLKRAQRAVVGGAEPAGNLQDVLEAYGAELTVALEQSVVPRCSIDSGAERQSSTLRSSRDGCLQ